MFHGMLLATSMLALFTLVSASLYPTQPIQSTVYYAGETALTTWIDDGSFPSLSNMGLITIQLYTDSNTYLGTLATDVSPLIQSRYLHIPRRLVYDGSNFHLRYLADAPYNMTIYSADFTVVVRGDSFPDFPSPIGSFASSTTTDLGPVSSSSSSSSSLAAGMTESQPPSPFSSSVSQVGSSVVIPPFNPSNVGSANLNPPSGKSKNGAAGGRLDTEKLKFRLVFILWPVALGVALAV